MYAPLHGGELCTIWFLKTNLQNGNTSKKPLTNVMMN